MKASREDRLSRRGRAGLTVFLTHRSAVVQPGVEPITRRLAVAAEAEVSRASGVVTARTHPETPPRPFLLPQHGFDLCWHRY